VLDFLYTAVSWVLLRWHGLLTFLGMRGTSGLTWSLAIVLLVITARLLLFRFFIKQVQYQRHMQELQPQIQKLREKYKTDRRQLQAEMMKLQQEQGFNPLAGCLPMLLQFPIFISLYHVLRHLANSAHLPPGDPRLTLYGFTEAETYSAARAKLFGAPLASSFHDSAAKIISLGGSVTATRVVTIILVIVSAAATYFTQRQAMRNAPTLAEGTAALIQRSMLYLIPFFVLTSGFIFPLGVLIYWFSSNLWTMGQQFYIYKYHPNEPKTVTAGASATTNTASAALKPAPGAKPIRPAKPNNSNNPKTAKPAIPSSSSESAPSPNGKSGAPRPGARPANRRPSQSRKKRR
jgi:YidC/Oxa1 family membrane protein insertase